MRTMLSKPATVLLIWDNSGDPYLRVLQYNSGYRKKQRVPFFRRHGPQGLNDQQRHVQALYGKPYQRLSLLQDLRPRCRQLRRFFQHSIYQRHRLSVADHCQLFFQSKRPGGWVQELHGYLDSPRDRQPFRLGQRLCAQPADDWQYQFHQQGGSILFGQWYPGAQLVIDYTPPQPNLTQAHYRWRNDDGPEQSVSVAVDKYNSTPANSGSSINLTLSGVTGTNRYLLVAVSLGSAATVNVPPLTDFPVRNVNSVTSNGTALTRLGYSEYTTTTPIRARTEIWGLKAPPTGTNTIVVTLNGALDTYRHAVVGAISFTGVNQGTPTNTVASQTGISSTCSINVPSASGELAFAVAGHATPGFTLTNAGNTQYWNNSTNSWCRAAGGTKPGASQRDDGVGYRVQHYLGNERCLSQTGHHGH